LELFGGFKTGDARFVSTLVKGRGDRSGGGKGDQLQKKKSRQRLE